MIQSDEGESEDINNQKEQEINNNQDNERQQIDENNDDDNNDDDNNGDENNNSKWKKIQKPQKQIKLYMIDFNQCDSKKCTGRKMQRFEMVKTLKEKERKKKFKGIVLSAFGDQIISIEDLNICLKYGICVIDCSWNKIQTTSQFRFKNQRILPYVVAGNPVNYGKPFQLSCVQAFATALSVINYVPQAEYIMSKFGWADGFWSINSSIRDYANCKTLIELEEMSKKNEEAQNAMKQRSYELCSDSSDSKSNDSENQDKPEDQSKS